MDPKKAEAIQTLHWAFQRMDWMRLERIAQAVEDLGESAVPVLRELAKAKYERKKAGGR